MNRKYIREKKDVNHEGIKHAMYCFDTPRWFISFLDARWVEASRIKSSLEELSWVWESSVLKSAVLHSEVRDNKFIISSLILLKSDLSSFYTETNTEDQKP